MKPVRTVAGLYLLRCPKCRWWAIRAGWKAASRARWGHGDRHRENDALVARLRGMFTEQDGAA